MMEPTSVLTIFHSIHLLNTLMPPRPLAQFGSYNNWKNILVPHYNSPDLRVDTAFSCWAVMTERYGAIGFSECCSLVLFVENSTIYTYYILCIEIMFINSTNDDLHNFNGFERARKKVCKKALFIVHRTHVHHVYSICRIIPFVRQNHYNTI